jgi:hypothetical protein
MSEREKIMEKVRKILAKAGNNPSAEEAETALLMAQRIMAEHGFEMTDIEAGEEPTKKEVLDESITNKGRHSWWEKQLSAIIADNFRCKMYSLLIPGGTIIKLIGLKEDVILAKELISYGKAVIAGQARDYVSGAKWRNHRVNGAGIKNDYITGFLNGLKEKFKKQVQTEGWGLVLTKDALVIQKIKDRNLRDVPFATHQREGSQDAYRQGYQDGQRFNDNKRLAAH